MGGVIEAIKDGINAVMDDVRKKGIARKNFTKKIEKQFDDIDDIIHAGGFDEQDDEQVRQQDDEQVRQQIKDDEALARQLQNMRRRRLLDLRSPALKRFSRATKRRAGII